MLNISLGLDQRNVGEVLKLILSVIESIESRLRSPRRSAAGRRNTPWARAACRSSAVPARICAWAAPSSCMRNVIDPEGNPRRLRAVTAEDIQSRMTRHFLDPRLATVAVIGPSPEEKTIKHILES